jgi:hypothetical protein
MPGMECPIHRRPKVRRTLIIVYYVALLDERRDTSVNQAISLFQS